MKIPDCKFNLGDMVYLKTDTDQAKRMITEIRICLDGGVLYNVAFGDSSYIAYGEELTTQKDYASI